MNEKVLVGYDTHAGSTREIAEAVGETLRARGLTVDVLPLRRVHAVDGYSAVVVGAPLYMFRWSGAAKSFLSRKRKILAQLPVAVFAAGPMEDKAEQWDGAREQIAKELARFDWLSPVAVGLFGGTFDAAKLHFPYSLIPAMKMLPAVDLRDWEEIRSWAEQVAQRFASGHN